MNSRPPISSVDPTEEAKHQHSSRKAQFGEYSGLAQSKEERAKVDKVEESKPGRSDY